MPFSPSHAFHPCSTGSSVRPQVVSQPTAPRSRLSTVMEVVLQSKLPPDNLVALKEEPHLGDSWCLSCSAVEQISGELRSAWGSAGSRAVARDVLVSATRQVRALRRLGIAGGGKQRPSVPEGAAPRASSTTPAESRANEKALPAPPPPPPKVPDKEAADKPGEVKEEAEESGGSEGEESETQAEDEKVEPQEDKGLKAVPKPAARADTRSEIPRRRTHERSEDHRERGADHRRASSRRREEDRHHRDRRGEPSRRDRSRSRRRREHDEPERKKKKKKKNRKRKNHRGGAKHQRLERAADNPFKRFHYKKPADFWDRDPGLH
eukprot:s81_g8.t1